MLFVRLFLLKEKLAHRLFSLSLTCILKRRNLHVINISTKCLIAPRNNLAI